MKSPSNPEKQFCSPSGLPSVPHIRWGSHLAQFFGSGDELKEVLVPYFAAGLRNYEACLWVTGNACNSDKARFALREVVPDLDERERRGQIEFANGEEWYSADRPINAEELVGELMQREQDALAQGYEGLRTNGNCAWVSAKQIDDFLVYESLVQRTVRGRRMICMCSYGVDQIPHAVHHGVMATHDLIVPSKTRIIANSLAYERPCSEMAWEQQKRSYEKAMIAAHMGTWCYTLADNICVYDENAQRLYGLTQSRFLHDEEGVKAKFHPDDLELMWSQVAKALDPQGDGRYDVEYRVKQLDGSWRWLSAWGLVEFEGEGAGRKPVAIVGASKDLSEQKRTEELQRLLLNETNHRVKNTFATIQAITAQTLRGASDLPSAKATLERRIVALSHAHDLLTSRSWTSANLYDLVARTLAVFAPSGVEISGEPIDIPPKHALALSLALHELATNAAKYGALSCPEGRVGLKWYVLDQKLHLEWEESGGPPVTEPTKKGFGSKLIEQIVSGDLGGSAKVNYAASGVRCNISVAI